MLGSLLPTSDVSVCGKKDVTEYCIGHARVVKVKFAVYLLAGKLDAVTKANCMGTLNYNYGRISLDSLHCQTHKQTSVKAM